MLVRTIALLALLLNVFTYFYPDIVNPGQCKWPNHQLHPRNPLLSHLPDPVTQLLLLNFPLLRKPQNSQPYAGNRAADIHMLAFGDPQINGNWRSTPYIKRLDNFGNDHYLGHIYKTMKNRLEPSHVAVMGDQFLLQWILDSEFYNRTHRFVDRIFSRDYPYKQTVEETWRNHQDYDWVLWLHREAAMDDVSRFQLRNYNDVYDWIHPENKQPNFDNPLFINLTGNHDIGYAGDATWQHMARFHYLFGQDNYVITYNRGKPEEWRLVVLNAMTLEGPALQEEFRELTWLFLRRLNELNAGFHGLTVLLTHIPMYKKAGLCADGPEHRYYENYEREPYKNGKLRLQNHLSYETTQKVLQAVFPNAEKPGLILTGHDHEGCLTYYNYFGDWEALKEPQFGEKAPIHEVVVRAMMGEYQGQTGLVAGSFDYDAGHWNFDFSYCSFVVQHWWWASKVAALVAVLAVLVDYIMK